MTIGCSIWAGAPATLAGGRRCRLPDGEQGVNVADVASELSQAAQVGAH
jgi:hypothetical protein